MYFLPFVSVILATAVLVTSEPSAQFDSFEIAALDGTALFTDKSIDGNYAGNFPSPPTGDGVPGKSAPQQIPPGELNQDTQQQQSLPPGVSPYGQQQESIPSDGVPPRRQQYGPPTEQQREQTPIPQGFTAPPPGYRGNQHCREYGGCPFTCHTDCVCWEWCKNAKCNPAVSGEAVLTPAQLSCDPSAGEIFIGKVCRPYCANWCEDIKNQIVQSLSSEQQQRAFLSQPLECDKNAYLCPGYPNPNGLDCLKPTNPLDPGLDGQSGSSGSYGNQQPQQPQQPQQQQQQRPEPNSRPPPGPYDKELLRSDATGIIDFTMDS